MIYWIILCVVIYAGITALYVYMNRALLLRIWAEPVFRVPVLVIESDDWGAGPDKQVAALSRLASILSCHKDSSGHPAVMTVGVILSIPDAKAMENNTGQYARKTLTDDDFRNIREEMTEGERAGVFSLQLHGLEHYWPQTLIEVAQRDDAVKEWLNGDPNKQVTEELPSHLQSRWTNATELPSMAHNAEDIDKAVKNEIDVFFQVFGYIPKVAVPPTFLWDKNVERAWYKAGVRIVVTPGRKYFARDGAGNMVSTGSKVVNGEQSDTGVYYISRDEYFEPVKGHLATDAIKALDRKIQQGRPCLLEMHRINFIGSEEACAKAEHELGELMDIAVRKYPDIRFLSTEEIMSCIRTGKGGLLEERTMARLTVCLERVKSVYGRSRIAWACGLMVFVSIFAALTKILGCRNIPA